METAPAVTPAPRRLPHRPRRSTATGSSRSRAPLARLTLDVAEDGGIRPGYKLKLNSYDLGVDIELADALNRIRFEHPEVRAVVVTSGKDRVFCSGANIFMLGVSSHAWKVNFCKFTNETRNGIEDASRALGPQVHRRGQRRLRRRRLRAGARLRRDRPGRRPLVAVSLPEVPLLGVLPGTGGLTRVIDKRKVRRDLADVFCTTAEGVRGQRAVEWRLVDAIAKPAQFAAAVARARRAARRGAATGPPAAKGVALTPLEREDERRRAPLRARRGRDRPRDAAPRRSPSRRPTARSPPTSPRIEAAGAALVAAARWRASSTTRS